jgi:hypothetical protein
MYWYRVQIKLDYKKKSLLPAALCPGVYSACNRNEYKKKKKMLLWSKALPTRKAENLIAVCEPIVLDNVEFLTSHNPTGLHGLL